MKEKLSGALGTFGAILYYLIRISVSALPLVMIDGGWLLRLALFTVMYFFPASGIIFWIWGLVCAIGGTQNWVAIVYYICFAVIFLPFFISCVPPLAAFIKSVWKSPRGKSAYILLTIAIVLVSAGGAYAAGHHFGYNSGYDYAYNCGFNDGYKDGHTHGEKTGHSSGYSQGYMEAKREYGPREEPPNVRYVGGAQGN